MSALMIVLINFNDDMFLTEKKANSSSNNMCALTQRNALNKISER